MEAILDTPFREDIGDYHICLDRPESPTPWTIYDNADVAQASCATRQQALLIARVLSMHLDAYLHERWGVLVDTGDKT